MSQPRARIASQLGLALAVILAIVISGSTVFALRSLDTANLARAYVVQAPSTLPSASGFRFFSSGSRFRVTLFLSPYSRASDKVLTRNA